MKQFVSKASHSMPHATKLYRTNRYTETLSLIKGQRYMYVQPDVTFLHLLFSGLKIEKPRCEPDRDSGVLFRSAF